MKNFLRIIFWLGIFLSTAFAVTAGAQNYGPVSTPQLNSTFFVGQEFLPTIQSGISYACTRTQHSIVDIPAGYAGTDLISAATGGCTAVTLHDERILPASCYAWGGVSYLPVACATIPNATSAAAGGVVLPAGKTNNQLSNVALSGQAADLTGLDAAVAGLNAQTANSLAVAPTPCDAGKYPRGVDAQGNSIDCLTAVAVPGANQQVLYNNNGTLGAVAGFKFDGTTLTTPSFAAGSSGRAQIAAGGSGGYSNFTLNGNNADGGRIGFIGGGTSDPNLYLDTITGGGFHFRANNADIGVLTATGLSLGSANPTHLFDIGTNAFVDVAGHAHMHSLDCDTGQPCGTPGGGSLPSSSDGIIYTDTAGVIHAAANVTTDGGNFNVGGALFLTSNGGGTQIWNNALRTTDEKAWDALNYDSSLHFRVRSDSGANANDWLTINRNALQPTQANFAEPIVTTGSLSSTTSTVNLHDAMPGFNLGANMGLGGGWYGQSSYLATFISESQGMHNGLSSSDFECKGNGDCNPFGFYAHSAGAATRPADEGMTTGRLAAFVGESNFKATVTAGGANATQLNFNAIGGSKGVGRPVIDTTDDVLNLTLSGCNGVYTSTNEASGYLLCTTSAPVPVSVQFTLNQDIQVSTNSSFPQTSVSFTILTPTALNVGDLIDIGGIYPESTRLTAVSTLSAGIQTVTAPLRYGHFNQTIAFGNPNGVGMAGRFLEYPSQTAMQTAHAKMTYNVLGSPDANHIAFFTSVTGKMDPLWGGNGVVNIYHGGYVTDVRDTTGGVNVDNNFHLALMDNDAPWTTGAGLEVTQEINQTWKGLAGTMDVYNPFGNGHFIDLECDPGSYACGNKSNDGATGFLYYRNANPLSFYTSNTLSGGTAGVANLGRVLDIAGPVGTFAYIDSSPVKPIFEFGGSAYGIPFIQIDDDQAGISFSHSDHSWSLTGQGVHLGTALSTSTNAVSVTQPTTVQGTDGPGTTSLKILPPLNGTGLALWNTGKAQTDGAALFNSSVTLAGLTTTPGGLNVTAHSCMLGADLNGNVGCNTNPISGTTFTGTRLDLQYNGSTVGQVTNNLSTFQIQSINGSTFALASAGQMRLSASGATGFGSGGIRFDSYITGGDGSGLTLRSNADSGHTGSPLVLQVSDYNLNTFQTVLQSNGVTTNGAHAGISLVPNGGTVSLGGDITPLHDTLASGATCGTHVANAIWADDAYIYHCNAAGTVASRAALNTY